MPPDVQVLHCEVGATNTNQPIQPCQSSTNTTQIATSIVSNPVEIIPEVAAIDPNKINHILTLKTGKHAWHKLVNNPADWKEVAPIISEVMKKGVEGIHKQVFKKTLIMGNETVVVVYAKVDGIIKIADAWVVTCKTI